MILFLNSKWFNGLSINTNFGMSSRLVTKDKIKSDWNSLVFSNSLAVKRTRPLDFCHQPFRLCQNKDQINPFYSLQPQLFQQFPKKTRHSTVFLCLFHQLLHLINTCDGRVVFSLVVGLFVAFFLDDFWFGVGYEAFVRELLTDHVQFFLPFSQFLVETS